MIRNTRNWRVLVGGVAAGVAAAVGFAGASASADPALPVPPLPAPATVTQTVTVTPEAGALNNQTLANPAATPVEQTGPLTNPAQPVAAPAAPPLTPATSGTLAEYFKEKGVTLEPQKSQGFTALNIVLPMPPGWSVIPDPNVPNAFSVIADRQGGDGLYTSNAQLLVSKLVGNFDPKDAITHGYVETQQLFAWQPTNASLSELGGFPAALIEGTYRENDLTLNTSRRYVLAQSGTDHYLLSLSVTTSASQVVATADATDAILNGFKVSAPGATPSPAVAAAPATAPPAQPAAAPAAAAAPTSAVTPVPVQQH